MGWISGVNFWWERVSGGTFLGWGKDFPDTYNKACKIANF